MNTPEIYSIGMEPSGYPVGKLSFLVDISNACQLIRTQIFGRSIESQTFSLIR